MLIEKGAIIKRKDGFRNSALYYAASYGNKEIVAELINRGADINVKNWKKWTSMQVACFNNNWEVVELLIDKGADTQLREKSGHDIFAAATLHKMLAERAKKEGNNDEAAKLYLKAAETFDRAGPAYVKMDKRAKTGAALKSLIGAVWSAVDLAKMKKTGRTSANSSRNFDWSTRDLKKFKEQCKIRVEMSQKLAAECRELAGQLNIKNKE